MIRLTWTDNSTNESGFTLEREKKLSSTAWGERGIFSINADIAFFDDNPNVGFYRYRIQSFNDAGSSVFTDWTQVQYTFPPEIPTNFNVSNAGNNLAVLMTWNDNSSNETVFHLIWDKKINGIWTRQPIISISANKTSYTHQPGPGTHRYCIRSAYSVFGVAYKSDLTAWKTVDVGYAPPAAPTNLVVTLEMDQSTVSFSWRDNSTTETVFHLIPQKLNGSTWTTLEYIRIPANSTQYAYKPGKGEWRFAIRSAFSVNGYAYKSALTPVVQIHVPLS